MKRFGKAAAASAVFGTGYILADLRPDYPVEEMAEGANLSFEVDDPALRSRLTVATDGTPQELVRRAVGSLGGMSVFVKPGETVVVKPNVGWDRTPEQAADTNPDAVGEAVRLCLEAGAGKVIVTDISCNDPRRTFLRSGIATTAEKAGAEVKVLNSEDDFREIDLGGRLLTSWPVLKNVLEADKFINMPVVKHHGLTRATLGMKNLYGILGGQRNQLHQSIDQSIVDLAKFCKPTLIVADCYRALMRNGPVGGSLADVKEYKTIVAGIDQVAVDTFLAGYLELSPSSISHVVLAEKSGLGTMQLNQIDIVQA
jgi:uncharacterized protein (DUF362 family)